MSTFVRMPPPDTVEFDDRPRRRRPAWRQRLVQAERGLVGGVRSDSVFFVHFFGVSAVIAAGFILGVTWMHWIGIVGCLTLVLTAEMFSQALKALMQSEDRPLTPAGQRALAMATAAVMVACAGSTIMLLLVFWQRLHELLGL